MRWIGSRAGADRRAAQPSGQDWPTAFFWVETMLRIHCIQQWFSLSDPPMEEALHHVPLYGSSLAWVME